MTKLEKVVDRIRKLKALSQSSNANEAALAAAEAQRLLSEYQLDEDSLAPSAEALELVDEDVLPLVSRPHATDWEEELLAGVCVSNGCVVIADGSSGKIAHLRAIGTRARVAIVKALFPLLHVQLQRLGREHVSRGRGGGLMDFMLGAVQTVVDKLVAERDAIRTRMTADGNARALERVDDDWRRANEYGEAHAVEGQGARVVDERAYQVGQLAGGTVRTDVGERRAAEAPRQLGSGS